MRSDLIEAVIHEVSGFHARPEILYDYQRVRRRLIFEGLSQGVLYVCNNAVEGDVAEFGTASGFSGFTIARALSIYQQVYADFLKGHGVATRKLLCLFDSFEGLPEPEHAVDRDSPNVQSGRWQKGTFAGLNAQELAALCASTYDAASIRVLPGWYHDSLPTIPPEMRFAMVHLDCDLYSSTFEVLDYLFRHHHVAEGAVLFFDDWNCNRSSPRMGQRRAWRETVERYRLEYSDCGDYAVIGHKFILHGSNG